MMLLLFVFALTTACAKNSGSNAGKKGSSAGLQTVYFDYDKSNIKSEYKEEMQSNADWMKKHSSQTITVSGHCDERGTNEYNVALGNRRATSAKSYLVNLGVPADRVKTVSFGEEQGVCYESSESCWWQNRRADFRK